MNAECGMRNAKYSIETWKHYLRTPNSELRTPNSKLRTPNSKLRTPNSKLRTQLGFTLIELIIFIVLAGIILPLIFIPFMTGLKSYSTPEIVSTATFLGEELMEEIKSKGFDQNPSSPTGSIGPESGEVRGTPPTYNDSTYYDVDDYNNLTENVSINNIPYNRSVTVFYVDPTGNLDTSYAAPVGNRKIKRILVTVTNAQIPNITLVMLVSQ